MCDGTVDVCEKSTDVCFAEIDAKNGIRDEEYACIEYGELFSVRKQRCLAGPIVDNLTSTRCCNEDGCNEHLDLPLPFALRVTVPDQVPTTPIPLTTGPTLSGPGMQM